MATIANMNVALSLDDRDFSAGIARAQGSAESFSKKLGGLGQTMSLAVTAPLVGIAAAAVHSAGQFEQSMNVMGQVTGATADQMATMQAQALELGAVTSFSAGEAAEAMLELGKAGLKPAEIGDAIAGTMDLAAAGNLDLANAASITANALNAFQLPAEEAANVANMFAAAANASSVDVTDLAAGMQMAGAVFSSNGQSIGDLSTAIAILGNNAVSGSDAGTSLKTMLLAMAAPTKEAAGVMADLGIEVFNADGSMRGFGDIVGNLETATNDLSDAERNMALKTIFGSDAIRAATILASEGADGFADMSKAVNKQGAAAATANARMKGIGGAIEYLKGSIDSFLINAALPFLDTLSGLVRGAADFLTTIGELPEPVRNTALAIGAILAAAGPVLLIISKLVPLFSTLGTVLGVLASPIGLIAVAVAALGVAWATNFMGIQDVTKRVLGPVIDGLQSFANYIGIVVDDGDTLNDWLGHLPTEIQPVVEKFGQLVATLKEWFDMAASGDFSGLWGSIGESLNAVKIAVAEFDWGDYITGTLTDWGTYITELDWGAFITMLTDWGAYITATLTDWGTYITKLDWGKFITTLSDWGAFITTTLIDWGTYITKLDWGAYILNVLSWGTYIKTLVWDDFIIGTLWAGYVKPVLWDDYISKIDWKIVAGDGIEWSEWLVALAWNVVISPIRWGFWVVKLLWENFISELSWSSFVPKAPSWKVFIPLLSWLSVLNPVSWAVFISNVVWTKFIPMIDWSGIADKVNWFQHIPFFSWPKFDGPDWGDFIPELAWPKIPGFPGWAEILRSFGWGGPPAVQGPAAAPSTSGVSPYSWNPPTTNGVDKPVPTNKGFPIDITPPPPAAPDISGMGGNVIGAVYVNNSVDINELAFKVAQANGRRSV